MLDYDKIELNKLLVEIDDTNLINHIVLTGYVIYRFTCNFAV
jgi:hypothetical protein